MFSDLFSKDKLPHWSWVLSQVRMSYIDCTQNWYSFALNTYHVIFALPYSRVPKNRGEWEGRVGIIGGRGVGKFSKNW